MIGWIEIVLLSSLLVAAAAWTTTIMVVRPRSSAPVLPAVRTLRARMWLYAPLWVPAVVLLASALRTSVGAVLAGIDPCHTVMGHHHHICVLHPIHLASHPVAWAVIAAVTIPVMVVLARAGRRVVRESQLTRALLATSQPSPYGADVRLLDTDEPVAVTVGALRPTVLLSRGITRSASKKTLQAILAHEREHVARRDTLTAVCERWFAALYPRDIAAALEAELSLAREQACDEAAAVAYGRLPVARALTEVARLRIAAMPVGVGASTSSLEARVVFLLHPPALSYRWFWRPAAALVGLFALGAGPGHTLIERTVSLLLHAH